MKRLSLAALALGAAACAGPPHFIAPANDGALACALQQAQHLNYRRLSGSVREGDIRVGLDMPPETPKRATDPELYPEPVRTRRVAATDYSSVPVQGQLRMRQSRGRLRIDVLSDRALQAGDSAFTQTVTTHAQQILSLCSAPTPP